MEKYAPKVKDLASRDVTSRAMYLEMRDGKGTGGKRYLYLDMRPETVNKYAAADGRKRPDGAPYRVTGEELLAKLPDIVDFARTYLGVDPVSQPMPVQPTAHYAMGGIPTDDRGLVTVDDKGTVIEGLYAAGECACVSVHGANRLGTNSLVDLVVFGRRAGLDISGYVGQAGLPDLARDLVDDGLEPIARLRERMGGPPPEPLREKMQDLKMQKVGIFRKGRDMAEAVGEIEELH